MGCHVGARAPTQVLCSSDSHLSAPYILRVSSGAEGASTHLHHSVQWRSEANFLQSFLLPLLALRESPLFLPSCGVLQARWPVHSGQFSCPCLLSTLGLPYRRMCLHLAFYVASGFELRSSRFCGKYFPWVSQPPRLHFLLGDPKLSNQHPFLS